MLQTGWRLRMSTIRRRFWTNKRFRLMLTLELAVMLPAAALIYVNFDHLKSIKRGKKVEATIYRDFQYVLAVSEKTINDKIYKMAGEIRGSFPSPDVCESDKGKALDALLSTKPWMAHAMLYDSSKG